VPVAPDSWPAGPTAAAGRVHGHAGSLIEFPSSASLSGNSRGLGQDFELDAAPSVPMAALIRAINPAVCTPSRNQSSCSQLWFCRSRSWRGRHGQADQRVAAADLHGRVHRERHIRRNPAPLSRRARLLFVTAPNKFTVQGSSEETSSHKKISVINQWPD
jgi:hypothetical protein